MKIIEQTGHQGDTQWYKVDGIPENAKRIEKQFIAASEQSGSFHALFGEYDMYEAEDGFIVDCKEDCVINHSLQKELANKSLNETIILPKKDHRHSVLKKGTYFVGIQQKFDPLAGIKKRVVD